MIKENMNSSLKYIFLIFFTLFFFNASSQVISFNISEQNKLKRLVKENKIIQQEFLEFKKIADKALTEPPHPIEKISTAGKLKGDPDRENSIKASKDFIKIWYLSFCFVLDGEIKYLRRAENYILQWSKINIPTGEPINETKLEPLLQAYDLLRSNIHGDNRKSIDSWLKSIAEAELKSFSFFTKNPYNNINSHRIKIITLIGMILNDKKYISYAESALRLQIEKNLKEDGSSWDFWERDALHYHCYTLEPLLLSSLAFKRIGKDYFKTKLNKNSSIKNSVDFLIPYIQRKKIHKEYVQSKINFDKIRSQNNQSNYATGRLFEPVESLEVFLLSSYFDNKYSLLINKYFTSDQLKTKKCNYSYILSLINTK